MTDCKPMVTPMVTNLKKLHDAVTGSDLVDPHSIQATNWIALILGAYQTGYLLCSECFESIYVFTEAHPLDCYETYLEISQRHSGLWTEIHLR